MANPTTTTVPQITFKSFKHAKNMSEETNAFTADLFIDGVKAAYCKNHGTGGCNDVHFIDKASEHIFRDYIANLPTYTCSFDGSDSTVNEDLMIGLLVEEYIHHAYLKRLCSRKTLFLNEGEVPNGEWRTYNKKWNDVRFRQWFIAKHPNATVLNTTVKTAPTASDIDWSDV